MLSVHLALTPDTRHFVGASILERLRPGSLFVNTARAEIVDHAALAEAVRERGIRAGLDVFRTSHPGGTGSFATPVVALPNVYGTHRIGASTEQAQEAIAAEAVRVIRVFMETGRVPNVVNLATRTPATHRLVVRHRDRPGVLAHVFDKLRSRNLNVQETENVIFEGASAAVGGFINLDAEAARRAAGRDRAGQRRYPQPPGCENIVTGVIVRELLPGRSVVRPENRASGLVVMARATQFRQSVGFDATNHNSLSTTFPPALPSCRFRCSRKRSAI